MSNEKSTKNSNEESDNESNKESYNESIEEIDKISKKKLAEKKRKCLD